jgi:hypothetical protein
MSSVDSSDQRATDAALRAATVATAFEQSTDVLMVTDMALDIEFVSLGTKRILGHEPQDVVGTNGLSYVHPDDVELLATTAFQTVEHGFRTRGATARYRVLDAQGEYQLLDIEGGPFEVEGVPSGFWMVGRRSMRGEVYAQVLELLLDERPLTEALANVTELFPNTGERVAVTSAPEHSEPFAVGDRLPAVLSGRAFQPGSPWDASLRTGAEVSCDDITSLDADTYNTAQTEQLASALVLPISGSSSDVSALLTVWHTAGMPSASTALRAAEPVRDLVQTALRLRRQFADERLQSRVEVTTRIAHELMNPLNLVVNYALALGEVTSSAQEDGDLEGGELAATLDELRDLADRVATHAQRASDTTRDLIRIVVGTDAQPVLGQDPGSETV